VVVCLSGTTEEGTVVTITDTTITIAGTTTKVMTTIRGEAVATMIEDMTAITAVIAMIGMTDSLAFNSSL
jgi:hypothetical protein